MPALMHRCVQKKYRLLMTPELLEAAGVMLHLKWAEQCRMFLLSGFGGDSKLKEVLLQCRLLEEGAKVGFPVLVKAALGGGGKGMKLAMQQDELEVKPNTCSY